MRSAPFQRFAVADSLGWLLFLKKIKKFLSRKLLERKKSVEFFFDTRVSASCPFICAPSSSFVFACNAASCWQVLDSLSKIQLHRALLSTLGKLFRVLAQWWWCIVFQVSDSSVKRREKWSFFRSQKLVKKRRERINSNTKTYSAQNVLNRDISQAQCQRKYPQVW